MTLILSGTNGVSDIDGDASTPALRGTDANSGVFFGSDVVGVSTGGSEKVSVGASALVINDGGADFDFRVEGDTEANLLFVDASTNRVGIGTNTPAASLDVVSSDSRFNLTSTGSGQTVGISIKGGSSGGDTFNFIESLNSGGTQAWYVGGNGTANTLAFKTNGNNERMRIDSSGNVQIGTTSAYNSAKLSVNGDLESRGNIKSYFANRVSNLTNGSTLNLMSFAAGNFGTPLCGLLNVQLRDDIGGNLTMSTYLMSGWGGSGAAFTAVSTVSYGLGVSFSIAASSVAGGELVITITNTSGRTASSQNFSFLALGSAIPTYAF